MDRLAAADRAEAPPPPAGARKGQARVALEREAADEDLADAPAEGCDLRGLRVEDALDRLVLSLDRAAVAGQRRLVVWHGLGSGALRDAVRGHLAHSPYVVSFARGDPTQGGDGITIVQLEDSAAQDR